MGCTNSTLEPEQKEEMAVSKAIDQQLQKDKKKKDVKLLLLGYIFFSR